MANPTQNSQIVVERLPSLVGAPNQRLNVIINGDGTFSLYLEDRANNDFNSAAGAITATGAVLSAGAGGSPGGLSGQLQYNNSGAFGGIVGATTDGTIVTFASGDLIATLPQFTQAGIKFGAQNVFRIDGTPASDDSTYIGAGIAPSPTGSPLENVAVGGLALNGLTTGTQNTVVGFGSANKLSSGGRNIAIGTFAMFNFTTGGATNGNVAVGYQAMQGGAGASGDANVSIGRGMGSITSGSNNVGIGASSLNAITTTSNNVAIGIQAGQAATGTGNVFIGTLAGAQQTSGDNKLYIANSNTTTPLIGGDFSANTLSLNAVVTVASQTATPANGSTSARLLFGTTAGFGIYYGSSPPSVSAAKGSLYLRSDGTGANDRAYINTDGGTTWTPIVTVG